MPDLAPEGGSETASALSDVDLLRKRIRELEAELADRRTQSGWTSPRPLPELWKRIEERMGMLPAFFEQAQAEPAIPWALFGLAEFAYLDSPPPSLFKEQLFTYLSRFCSVRYCVARHCAFLIGEGFIAGDAGCEPMEPEAVRRLLEEPLPNASEQDAILRRLAGHPRQLTSWPLFESELGKDLFFACAAVMLEPGRTSDYLAQLRRLLGPVRIEQLLLFLGFIRMAHYWTEVHPNLALENDLEHLVRAGSILAEPLLKSRSAEENWSLNSTRPEDSVNRQRRHLLELLKATDQIVWTTDSLGVVHDDSPSWRAFTGQSTEEWMGSGWLDAVHPDDRAKAADAWRQAVQSKQPYAAEYRIRNVNGSWRWTAARAYPVITPAGGVEAWVGLNVDITALKDAEANAKESEERFRLLVQGARNTAIFALDPEGRVQSWNEGAARITGYEATEILGKGIEVFFPTEDRTVERAKQLLVTAAREGEVRDRNWRMRKSGERYWADVAITAHYAEDGSLTGFSDILRDLTEERNYVLALEESEERARLLFENAAQGIIGAQPSGVIEFANSTACRIFGYSPEELTGRPIDTLLPEPVREIHALHRASFAEHPQPRQMAVGRELSARRANGEIFPVEVFLASLNTSRGVLHVAFVIDITERVRGQEAFHESMQRFRLLSENVPELIWTCLPDGKCDYLNQRWADYTGIPSTEQLGFEWLNRLHPHDREPAMAAWQAAVEKQTNFSIEFRIRRHDGAYRWFQTSASALRNERGEILKWFGSNTDVHDLRMAMKELETANAELESFAYIAAHDMQEPLRTAVSFTQLLERHLEGKLDERGIALMGHVSSSARRMSQLFTDLLRYTEAGSETRDASEVNLSSCAATAVSNLATLLTEQRAQVEIDSLPTVLGIESQFVQIFQNLIGNAVKYRGPDDPVIRITGSRNAAHCTIRVSDNGIGIEPRDQGTIFKLFTRLDGRETEGTGIGLAICQRIVNRLGGRIWVESGGKGQGATFAFELPLLGSDS